MASRKLGPALAAGCAAVVKPAAGGGRSAPGTVEGRAYRGVMVHVTAGRRTCRSSCGLTGSARRLRWEQDGNTCAVHERSRPIPADPVASRMTWANDSGGPSYGTGVVDYPGLQSQGAACRVAGGFDSRPPPPPPLTSDERRPYRPRRVGSQACSTWSSRCSTHAWLTNFSAHLPPRGDQVHNPQPGASATTRELNASAVDADPLRARCGLTGSSTGINSPSSVLVTRT